MKRTRKRYRKFYYPLRLYKDDLRAIIELAAQSGDIVRIKVGEYTLDAPKDLDQLKGRPVSYMNIWTAPDWDKPGPHRDTAALDILMSHFIVGVKVGDSGDTQLMGIALQLDAFLKSKYSWISYLTSVWGSLAMLLVSILVSATSIAAVVSQRLPVWLRVLPTSLPFIVMGVCIWSIYTQVWRHVVIFMTDRDATPGFLARNRDQLIVNLIVAIVAAIFGTLATLLISGGH